MGVRLVLINYIMKKETRIIVLCISLLTSICGSAQDSLFVHFLDGSSSVLQASTVDSLVFGEFNSKEVVITYHSTKQTSIFFLDEIDSLSFNPVPVEVVNLRTTFNSSYSTLASWNTGGTDNHDDINFMGLLHVSDLMGEDMVQTKSHWFTYDYTHDNRLATYRRPLYSWTILYRTVDDANMGISKFKYADIINDPKSIYRQVLGEAYALRAFSYMYLIQLFQNPFIGEPDVTGAKIDRTLKGVPIRLTDNDSPINSESPRATVGEVLDFIESDLQKAAELLKGRYRWSKNSIDEHVVYGLQARYYLMLGKWNEAAEASRKARLGYRIMTKDELYSGFMTLSTPEWMWGFDHNLETQTMYASFFSHISNLSPGYAGLDYAPRAIDRRLYDSIPATDYRKRLFNDSAINVKQENVGAQCPYANLKFGWDGAWTMDYVYMRASEMVLIEAEALARQGKNSQAAAVLKELMQWRDPSWNKSSVVVDDVLLQRRIELWGEGFSYFDLKRLYKGIDRTYEGSNHRSPDALLKIPAGDIRWVYQIPQSVIDGDTIWSNADNNP